ncbi:MAG: hypothetical protein K6T26_03815 [Alicyclobacillus sp.]|nr:hypothetical protein [Alicyclobacillus sp.]
MNSRDRQSSAPPSSTAPPVSAHADPAVHLPHAAAHTAELPQARWPRAATRAAAASERESSLVDVDSPDDFPFEGQQANIVPPTGG